ncbi:MAG TPA: MlaD family protein [Polyangiaceae bacterium]|nr:MlaD family protein [Polyangiaceae bacterium]
MALSREVKVGAFVAAGLAVAGLVVFLIGDERRAFEKKVDYYAVFDDVQGLTRGAPVRMGGVDVGQVADVGYGPDVKDTTLHVTLSIVKAESRRIRSDSVVSIGNKGLLGDKMVVIKVGSTDRPQMEPGATLPTEKGMDLAQISDRISAISEKAETVMTNLEKTTNTFADPSVQEDLKTTVRSLSRILKSVDEGDGYVTRLLKDPAEANRLSSALESLKHATGELDQTLARADQVMARVQAGPGFAHDVLYGEGPTDAIAQIGRAAGELASTLEGMRKGNGLAHSVIYGDDATQQLIGDLNSIAKDVKGIVKDVRSGKGTVGALMVDPSVYEDIKTLLGNVERNKTLRALVRYSIQRDEKTAPTVEAPDPPRDTSSESAQGGSIGAVGRVSAP